ncbi:MAG: magnesium transporter [Myxococcota bacterium]
MRDRRGSVLEASLLRLVRRGAWANARKLLDKSHPADTARVLDRLPSTERKAVFDLIRSDEERAEVLCLLQFTAGADLLAEAEPEAAGRIVGHMTPDDAANLLRQLPRETTDGILSTLGNDAEAIERLLGYGEDTAGAIMSPEFFALSEKLTAKEAIEQLQLRGGDAEASFYVYVVDDRGILVGVLSLRQLIMQPPYKTLRDIMVSDPIRVATDTDQEEVAQMVARYDLLALPVVDSSSRLVGVVTVDDVIDVLREEATEDILKLAGTTVEEVTSPGVLRGAWIRLPWLTASFLGGFLGIFLLSRFEGTLASVVQLAFFLPIVLGMGGNVGSQCSMVVVRGIATGRLEIGSVGRIIGHEVGTTILLAVLFAVGLGAAATLMGYGPPRLPLVVGAGMFASMVIAAGLGALLPVVLSRLGFDPAIASGPFVTTSTDILGILTFCVISTLLL